MSRCRSKCASFLALTMGALALGCHTVKKYDTSVAVVEEFTPPPNEDRYNNPPEAGYRKPPVKKDIGKQGIGPMGPGMGGVGGPGMGGIGSPGFGTPGR